MSAHSTVKVARQRFLPAYDIDNKLDFHMQLMKTGSYWRIYFTSEAEEG